MSTSPPNRRVTNTEVLAAVYAQGDRITDIGKRLDDHVVVDEARHDAERDVLAHDMADFRSEVRAAIGEHLRPYSEILPTLTRMVANRKELDVMWVQMGKLRTGLVALTGLVTGVGGAVVVIGKILHKW